MQIEIKPSDCLSFENVEVKKPLTDDVISAEMLAEKTEGFSFFLALISVCCTFDGKKLTYEDLKRLDAMDFFALLQSLMSEKYVDLARLSSASQRNGDLASEI